MGARHTAVIDIVHDFQAPLVNLRHIVHFPNLYLICLMYAHEGFAQIFMAASMLGTGIGQPQGMDRNREMVAAAQKIWGYT